MARAAYFRFYLATATGLAVFAVILALAFWAYRSYQVNQAARYYLSLSQQWLTDADLGDWIALDDDFKSDVSLAHHSIVVTGRLGSGEQAKAFEGEFTIDFSEFPWQANLYKAAAEVRWLPDKTPIGRCQLTPQIRQTEVSCQTEAQQTQWTQEVPMQVSVAPMQWTFWVLPRLEQVNGQYQMPSIVMDIGAGYRIQAQSITGDLQLNFAPDTSISERLERLMAGAVDLMTRTDITAVNLTATDIVPDEPVVAVSFKDLAIRFNQALQAPADLTETEAEEALTEELNPTVIDSEFSILANTIEPEFGCGDQFKAGYRMQNINQSAINTFVAQASQGTSSPLAHQPLISAFLQSNPGLSFNWRLSQGAQALTQGDFDYRFVFNPENPGDTLDWTQIWQGDLLLKLSRLSFKAEFDQLFLDCPENQPLVAKLEQSTQYGLLSADDAGNKLLDLVYNGSTATLNHQDVTEYLHNVYWLLKAMAGG